MPADRDPTPAEMEEFDLPFANHYVDATVGCPQTYYVWTTCNGEDTVDIVCQVDVDRDDDGTRAQEIAEFVTDALNYYLRNAEARKRWAHIHKTLPIASGGY